MHKARRDRRAREAARRDRRAKRFRAPRKARERPRDRGRRNRGRRGRTPRCRTASRRACAQHWLSFWGPPHETYQHVPKTYAVPKCTQNVPKPIPRPKIHPTSQIISIWDVGSKKESRTDLVRPSHWLLHDLLSLPCGRTSARARVRA